QRRVPRGRIDGGLCGRRGDTAGAVGPAVHGAGGRRSVAHDGRLAGSPDRGSGRGSHWLRHGQEGAAHPQRGDRGSRTDPGQPAGRQAMDSGESDTMSTATHTTHSAHTDGSGRSSRQLQDDIRHTRQEMDQTLDELGERLHPRHLLDDVVEIFRGSSDSDRAQQLADTCKRAGGTAAQTIREHPLPAALIAAGVALWIFEDSRSDDDDIEWERLDEYGNAQLQQVRAYDEDDYEPVWRQEIMPWHEAYAWEDETEEDWSQRTRSTLESLKQTLGDQSMSALQKVQHTARKVMPLTGHKQKEIHSRWSNLRE